MLIFFVTPCYIHEQLFVMQVMFLFHICSACSTVDLITYAPHFCGFYMADAFHGARFLLFCSGEIFELKAELNSDKKEKKKEAVKKVIASMTVGKDVR